MRIKRKIYTEILEHLSHQEITLIVGSRQAGKTTIIKQLQTQLEEQGKKTLFFNLDIESDFSILETQEKLLFAIRNQVGASKAYIFIDEFQRKVNGGKFLKGLYDMGLPYKFIVTGSGSIELKEQVHESLAGRKRIFEVGTLTFEEYLDYQTNYEFENKQEVFAKIYPERAYLYLLNYMTFGGYPQLALVYGTEEKRQLLQGIYNSYLIKDITALLKIEKTNAFQKLIENLSILDGKLLNISQLSSRVGIASQTLEKYLWYLEKTYIISIIRPFSGNPLKEINKSYTCYFNDMGLKNLISANFNEPSTRVELGFDFQNYVFLELKDKLKDKEPVSINFWRTKDDAEVDFVIQKGKKIVGVECKFSDCVAPKYTRSLQSFVNKYKPESIVVVNKSFTNESSIDNTKASFLPYYEISKVAESI